LSFNSALRDVGVTPDRWDIDNHKSWFHSWPHMPQRERFAGPRNPMVSHMPPHMQIRVLQEQLASVKQEAEAAKQETEAARGRFASATAAFESATAERDLARRETEDLKRQSEAQRQVEAARRTQLEHDNLLLRQSLESARRETDATIAAIHASTSWRVAAPLRQIKRWIA
jgi:hypothetical protein